MWDFEVDGDQMTFEASSQNQTLPVLAFRLSSPKSARARAHHSEFGSPDSSRVHKPIDPGGSFGRIPSTLGLLRISGRHRARLARRWPHRCYVRLPESIPVGTFLDA